MATVSCFPSDNKYLDCKCYLRLKNYFYSYGTFSVDDNRLKNMVKSAKITSNDGLENNVIFKSIKQHLNGDGMFIVQNPTECCRYINFWLNKEVQGKLPHLHTNTSFNIFQDFLKSYHTHKNRGRCENDIKYIDPSELQKMKAVYDLYDKYKDLSSHNKIHGDSLCYTLLLMSRTYNDYMRNKVETDTDLFSRLNEFKKLIDKDILRNYECTQQIHFVEADLFLPTELKRLEEEKKAQTMSTIRSEPSGESLTSQSIDSKGIKGSSEGHELTESSKERGEISLPELDTVQEGRRLPENGSFQEEHTLQGYGEASAVTETLERSRSNEELRYSTDSGYPRSVNWPYGNLSSPDDGPEADVQREARNVSENFFGTLQNSLSSIVQNVDPVPVVGVSGGMGALFLLFRVLEILNLQPLCTIHLNKNKNFHEIIL
ncbi:hypothetical protein PVNG_05821 [Plasmodium vivax North Korean]|uniref:VIR protein n=1 Tax=Plasmodium vivax North Korean TaxID=1035514 RepID=A0A0J9WEM0_PLAVI|nr:hypothetical protein PVNG_05821 [Plasmodium vivax North Korean]